jgi:hypothetical protein
MRQRPTAFGREPPVIGDLTAMTATDPKQSVANVGFGATYMRLIVIPMLASGLKNL